jgi:hypothetical protein
MIRQDFQVLDARETLRTTWATEQLILLQSVHGHSHEGHGIFHGRRYPNTTLDDVTRALRLDPVRIRAERQELIDSIAGYANRVIRGNEPPALLDEDDHPLLGISTLRFLQVKPADVLRGLYVGGLRDEADLRMEVERERGIRIGSGRSYFVDYDRMRALGLNADELAKGEWDDDIARFRREGLIVDEQRAEEQGVTYQYIRHQRGPGASDDAAIVAAGMLWGPGVSVGVFFADAIDTLEKYVPAYRDQDADLALRIEKDFPELRFGREEARTLTYLAAIPENVRDEVPDSSLRHLLSIDRQKDMCALEAHLLAVQGVPAPSIGLSHERAPSARFYAYVRERIRTL